ncbi:hypothetical protein ACHAWC_003632 [Mediolabrus comicus]
MCFSAHNKHRGTIRSQISH